MKKRRKLKAIFLKKESRHRTNFPLNADTHPGHAAWQWAHMNDTLLGHALVARFGCCDNVPQAEWCAQQTSTPYSSGSWTSAIMVPARSSSLRASSASQTADSFLHPPRADGRSQPALWPPLPRARSWGLHPHDLSTSPKYLPEVCLPNSITWGLGFQHINFRDKSAFQPIVLI